MPHLEPTYLRYIYDGLVKGSIHPENSAELPEGLIGLYEEAFDDRTSVIERQKLLQRFAIWALLKKEVSAAFVAEVLDETEDDIQEFISTYSAWFNSPESGKYQLYHERLKVYLLQKLSEKEIYELHENLIGKIEQAIEGQKANEFEWYGLEFLTSHLSVAAMLNVDDKKLIELAYSKTHWQRQLKISKGYSWTKNGLKEVMTWASKYNDDEVIECGLQMVDLHHQEQNAAPQIVALVAEGDFDAALKRIEQFGGNDKDGLKRKFILYMLCLMELTLLDSKDKPGQKVGIERLMKHLEEHLPIDHSVLNWGEFFPSHLIFKMANEIATLQIDFVPLFQRANFWENDWIAEYDALNDQQISILIKCTDLKLEDTFRISLLQKIATLFFEQNRKNEAFSVLDQALCQIHGIDDEITKFSEFNSLSIEYVKKGDTEKAIECVKSISDEFSNWIGWALHLVCNEYLNQQKINEAYELIKKIDDHYWKAISLSSFGSFQVKNGDKENGWRIINMAIDLVEDIVDEVFQIKSLCFIADQLGNDTYSVFFRDNIFRKVEVIIDSMTELIKKSHAYLILSVGLFNQNKKEKSILELNKALKFAEKEENLIKKHQLFLLISEELIKHNKKESSLLLIKDIISSKSNISDDYYKRNALSLYIKELLAAKKKEEVNLTIDYFKKLPSQKNISILIITNELSKNDITQDLSSTLECLLKVESNNKETSVNILKEISMELAKKGKFKLAIQCVERIESVFLKSLWFQMISTEFYLNRKNRQALLTMQKSIDLAQSLESKHFKFGALAIVSYELARQNETIKAIDFALNIDSPKHSIEALLHISKINFQKKNISFASKAMKLAIQSTNEIEDKYEYCSALILISEEHRSQGKTNKAFSIIKNVLKVVNEITDEYWKRIILREICIELAKQGKLTMSFLIADQITEWSENQNLKEEIICQIADQGRIEEALNLLRHFKINSDIVKEVLVRELLRNGNFRYAEELGLEIGEIQNRQNCWINSARYYLEFYDWENTLNLIREFNNSEVKTYFFKGFTDSLNVLACNKNVIKCFIRQYENDVKSLEKLLQKYVLNNLFFHELSENRINHFNRTLDIQWAIDIKNQLPN